MSTGAERFIDALAKRDALPGSILKRLNDKVANSSSVPSARSLATFLVDKGHLSREDADAALAESKPTRRTPKRPAAAPTQGRSPGRAAAVAEGLPAGSGDPASVDVLTADPATAADLATDAGATGPKKRRRKYQKKTKGDNEFDTPLMLLGGGGLVLLLLVGAGILFLLFRESGDELLENARKAFEAGAYRQAVLDYSRFTDDFTGHEKISTAQVMLGVARIRETPESNHKARLQRAREEIRRIEDEEEFLLAQEELAGLLPTIARGLADKADSAEEIDQIVEFSELARSALTLCDNRKYVPSRLTDKQELADIRETLERVRLRQQALTDLRDTLSAMRAAVAKGDTKTAYAAHSAFVKAHAERAADPLLREAVAATSRAEQAGVRFIEGRRPALTAEAKTAVVAAVATADRRRTDPSPATGTAVVEVRGFAYAFDRRSGAPLWRRPLGPNFARSGPVVVGDGCLLIDAARQELVFVETRTGKLRWRAPLMDEVTQPIVVGDRVLAAGVSGKLHVLQLSSGEVLGHVAFAQPLGTPPVFDPSSQRVYLVGKHSSVYTLDSDSLACLGVYYLGHAEGTVVAPPRVVLNRVVVLENDGASTGRLHVLAVDEQGVVAADAAVDDPATRLDGLGVRPPVVFGKQFAVATASGFVGVYEASSDAQAAAFTPVVQRRSRRRLPNAPYAAMIDGRLWVAGSGLASYSIQAAVNQLRINELAEAFRGDTFVCPLDESDGVLIHVRRRRGRTGVTVAASDAETGRVYWATDVALPAAGPPIGATDGRSLLQVCASGDVFVINEAAMRTGVTSEKLNAPAEGGPGAGYAAPQYAARQSKQAAAPLVVGAATGGTGVYLASQSGAALAVDTTNNPAARSIHLPSGVTAAPTRFAKGWLAPLEVGQLVYFDGTTGQPLAAPFQPSQAPRPGLRWRGVTATEVGGRPVAIATESGGRLFAVELLHAPAPHLAAAAERDLAAAAVAFRAAVSREAVAVVTPDPRLLVLSAATLATRGESKLPAPVVWGPFGTEGGFVLATADDRLHMISAAGDVRWASQVNATTLLGRPQATDGFMMLSHSTGQLEARSPDTGEVGGRTSLGQAIARAAIRVSGRRRMLASAGDGALLLIDPGALR